MNIEELKRDLEELQALRDQALAQVNAYEGAIQYIKTKIQQVESKESEEPDLADFQPGAASHRPEAAESEEE
jgi:hypothetical protein